MDSTNIWNKFNLYRNKIICLVILMASFFCVEAQFNKTDYDNKRLYFGILFGYNETNFRIEHHQEFVNHDSILAVISPRGPGFNLGVVMNYRLSKHFDLRATPGIAFSIRKIQYSEISNNQRDIEIESVLVQQPVWLKFKSERYKELRFYVLAGLRVDYDLASNSKKRKAVDILKLNALDVSADYGIGIQLFFPNFILAPEICISQGIPNLHSPTQNLQYSNVLNKLFSRSITFRFHVEG